MNAARSGTDYKALVLQAVDIVQLVGQSVALKRRGKDYVGLCPFHSEKTPSFHVSPTKQFFRCYGCKAGGNAIDFVMQRDRVAFMEALRALGEQAGVEMPKFGVSKEKMGERQVLLEAHSAACGFFEKLLTAEGVGAIARAYLEKRGINAESVKRFQIGIAPDAWDGLLRSPVMKKYPASLLQQAGLLKSRDNANGFYDTFRNRLIFPIRDENGRVIAFGARKMRAEDEPKYLNSPETPLFSKSRCLFGIDLARQRIVETRTVAVVEGYTDVVMAHQFGVSNVVAPLGTALTEQHVAIMRRFADKIVLLFDADTAGDAAVNRAVQLFLTQPIEIAIASMPEGLDPDEYLLAHGAEAFEKVLAGASDALAFKWKQLDRQFAGSTDLTGRQKAVEEYLGTLSAARGSGPVDSLRWGQALSRVSRLTDVPVDELNKRFRTKKPVNRMVRPASAVGSPGTSNESESTAPRGPLTARDRAEQWILGILLSEPQRWHEAQQLVSPTDFADPTRRKLAEIYWGHQRDEGEPVFSEFLSYLTEHPALTELAVELVDEIESLEDASQHLADAVNHLAEIRRRSEEYKLVAELRRTSDAKLPEQAEVDLLKKLQDKARTPDLRRVGF